MQLYTIRSAITDSHLNIKLTHIVENTSLTLARPAWTIQHQTHQCTHSRLVFTESPPSSDLPLNCQMGAALKNGGKPVEASGVPLDVSFHDDQDGGKKFEFLSETLRFRAQKTPEHVLFSLLDSKAHVAHKFTCAQLHRKAERIAGYTQEKAKLNSGDNVALLFPAGRFGLSGAARQVLVVMT